MLCACGVRGCERFGGSEFAFLITPQHIAYIINQAANSFELNNQSTDETILLLLQTLPDLIIKERYFIIAGNAFSRLRGVCSAKSGWSGKNLQQDKCQ